MLRPPAPAAFPRFSFAKTYEPPLDAYAFTPWTYERTTMTMKIEIAIESGKTRCAAIASVATSTASAASVA